MAKTKTIDIKGVEYKLQAPSIEWYLGLLDRHNVTGGGKQDTVGLWDEEFKNIVVSPAEVTAKGIKYFVEIDDMAAAMKVHKAIDTFLAE